MANRIFHRRFTFLSITKVVFLGCLLFFLLWIKQGILALFVVIIFVVLMERILHTVYVFTCESYADGRCDAEVLIIGKGRFSTSKRYMLGEIDECLLEKSRRGSSRRIQMIARSGEIFHLDPREAEFFVREFEKRKHGEDKKVSLENNE